jgi:hypothetical protein
LARVVAGAIAIFVAVGLVLGAKDLMSRPTPLSVAATAAFIAFTLAVVRMLTRPQPVFGTPDGLISKLGTATTTIPWSKVGPVECPVSSFNPIFRRYYVTVLGEEKRIYFFAGHRELERLEKFRAKEG